MRAASTEPFYYVEYKENLKPIPISSQEIYAFF
jgi:hypothetical protein